jgi:hypothetical protein
MKEVFVAQFVEDGEERRRFLGLPLGGFGLIASLLLVVATGFFTFFLTTCLSIFALMAWNGLGGHQVNYADSYLYVGMPAGAAALVVSFFVFGALWIRSKMH